MQLVESSNTQYNAVEGIVVDSMKEFQRVTGREYSPFEYRYFGTSQPTVAIVCMGSSVKVVEGTLRYLKSEQACLIGVRMFRPWSTQLFTSALPRSVSRVAVLDRTREGGSQGGPLYLDICTSLMQTGRGDLVVAGGRYGLGSKDFTPRMVDAVIHNMQRRNVDDIKRCFTVGIDDDVTNLSLSLGRPVNTLDDSITQCVFWGFGSDGTVGGNKEAVKIIAGYHEHMSVQAYFEYDAKKSSGWTVSHLRFSPLVEIEAPFCVEQGQAGYVACHNESYVQGGKYDVVKFLKRGGTFFLNTTVASIETAESRLEALESLVAPKILRALALRRAKFYIMDAARLAASFGLAGRINMICMCTFFKLAGVLPLDMAVSLLKLAIAKTYANKGENVVNKNIAVLESVVSDPAALIRVDIPARWRSFTSNDRSYLSRHIELIDDEKMRKFMTEIVKPVSRLEGDTIPVSVFLQNHLLGGVMIAGTTRYEKRNPNPSGDIPLWDMSSCTQCNQCVFVCPHAAIRPFIVSKEEVLKAPFPKNFESLKASGSELAGNRFALIVSPLDCTGCNACVEACPENPKALKMGKIDSVMPAAEQIWDYAMTLPDRGDMVNKYSVKGSQFQTPLMEFSGACSGCGETPYFKLLTQLFGERMVIANATGCSTIWGGSFPSNPYTVSKKSGRGPAWANSLFEDNAEYGFGMFSASSHRRERLTRLVQDYVHHIDIMGANLKEKQREEEKELVCLLSKWLDVREEKSDKCTLLFDKMKPLFLALISEDEAVGQVHQGSLLNKIWSDRDMFPKLSQWIVGGDGWAYDIGFGGLDHVEAFAKNDINVLVVDTEMYSNTGGQQSKATPAGASVKFARGGKKQAKKNLGEIFMTYEHVYVASISLSHPAQVLQAFVEADRHNGPSIIIAYSPCIEQQVRPRGLNDMFEECRYAVESGYWPLYRFNPKLVNEGKNPFILDSKKLRKEVSDFLKREGRFLNLKRQKPKIAEELFAKMNADVHHRMAHLIERAAGYKSFEHKHDASVRVLFASETGNAARVARDFAAACTLSHDADAMDDTAVDDLDGATTIFFIATCGQGVMPRNGQFFSKELSCRTEPFTKDTRFMVLGLGDSSYFFFCKAAKDVQSKMLALGAKEMLPLGYGDDSVDGGMEEGLNEWLETVWPCLDVPPPAEVPHITPVNASFSEHAVLSDVEEERSLYKFFQSDTIHAISLPVIKNELQCRKAYTRDFRIIQFEKKIPYEVGDALEIFPQNDPDRVAAFLREYSIDFDERTVLDIHDWGVEGEISLGSLFTRVLDLFGKPSAHFMQQLATFESDEEDRKTMLDKSFLKEAGKMTGITIAQALGPTRNDPSHETSSILDFQRSGGYTEHHRAMCLDRHMVVRRWNALRLDVRHAPEVTIG
jgi:homodimeric pyruvate:ferredoxin (flavodoxin) oxidoreductase